MKGMDFHMRIKALVENTSVSKNYGSIHGLSLYIETENHKILFDLGPGKLFLENAEKMKVNIEAVDTVIISHGHYDHGGGLKTFLEHNKKAMIYLRDSAFMPYYSSLLGLKFYIGLDKTLEACDRFVFTKEYLKIDDELQLFSNITEHSYLPDINNKLYKKEGKKYIPDTFDHEQNLLIRENDTYTLIAGCAHNGIYNILTKAEKVTGENIKTVISGFHLYKLEVKKSKDANYLAELAGALKTKQSKFYTCHCTGQKSYRLLKKEMGEQMNYISTGAELNL
jgi:7,8-dihydropterin-6-yl-methyl-4-(beta-D-ribofuranosyl)aminobenzene 5'-phosphate synthase